MNRSLAVEADATVQAVAGALVWAQSLPSGTAVAALSDLKSIEDHELANLLSDLERAKAGQMSDPAERRHYIFRRCFQRVFLCLVMDWQGSPRALALAQGLDMQPKLLDLPSLQLSFSTSGSTAVACASFRHAVGIDLEMIRPIDNVIELSRRFFSAPEAKSIASAPASEQSHHFLKHWTAKEAGLKAMGKGIVAGLNSITLIPDGETYNIEISKEFCVTKSCMLRYLDILPGHVTALVHRSVD